MPDLDLQHLNLHSGVSRAYIGLGANLGNPLATFRKADQYLQGHPHLCVVARSPLYRTKPIGPIRQPWYINGVIILESRMGPKALLRLLHRLEACCGRDRRQEKRWGPRLLDLDLLFYGNRVVHSRDFSLPHPRLHQRCFVLRPLADIAPDFVHPVFGKTVDTMLQEVDDGTGVQRLFAGRMGLPELFQSKHKQVISCGYMV